MAIDNSRPEDYNEETEFSNFEETPVEEQPQEPKYEDYVNNEPMVAEESTEEDDIPEKYQGKDVKDIVAMHQNAEKLLGKQSQEVGELRKVVDDFIRSQTVQQQQAPVTDVTTDEDDDLEFFENPKAAVNKLLENHPAVRQSKEASIRLAQQEAAANLKAKHPDYTGIVSDKAFLEWVGSSKVRIDLLRKADAYDFDSADELLSLWKDRQSLLQNTVKQETQARKQSIKNGSTGNVKGSNERPSKKIYRRADIVELMAKDPERYSALAAEIRQAYAEGRVR
jgi:hypothetical protein